MNEQNELNKEVETIKRNEKEILQVKKTMTEMKNVMESFKNRFTHPEEIISKLKDTLLEINQLDGVPVRLSR